jgi:hypothetical protein
MKNLTNPTWIKAQGLLFLFLGLLSATLLFLEHPTLRGIAADRGRLVFLPFLLLRILRDRTVRGSKLSVLRARVTCAVLDLETTAETLN